jgi:hypothetical protein
VRLLGFQSVVANPDINLLVFEHSCGSTVSILSRRLRHLLPELEPGAPAARLLAWTNAEGPAAAWRTWKRATRLAATRVTDN